MNRLANHHVRAAVHEADVVAGTDRVHVWWFANFGGWHHAAPQGWRGIALAIWEHERRGHVLPEQGTGWQLAPGGVGWFRPAASEERAS